MRKTERARGIVREKELDKRKRQMEIERNRDAVRDREKHSEKGMS